MGTMHHYVCRNCGFDADLGSRQPYYIMTGSIVEKYCPETKEIVDVFRQYDQGPEKISCQDKDWQEEFGDPACCQNCKGECLKDLEIISLEDQHVEAYRCPRCGDSLQCDHFSLILVD